MFKTAVTICSFNCLIDLKAKCRPSNGSNFIVFHELYTQNINATMQALTRITGPIDPLYNKLIILLIVRKERDEGEWKSGWFIAICCSAGNNSQRLAIFWPIITFPVHFQCNSNWQPTKYPIFKKRLTNFWSLFLALYLHYNIIFDECV